MTPRPRDAMDVRDVVQAHSPLRALGAAVVEIDRADGADEIADALARHARTLVSAGRCAVEIDGWGDRGGVSALSVSPADGAEAPVPRDGCEAGGGEAHRGLVVAVVGHAGDVLGRLTLSEPDDADFDRDDAAILDQIALIAAVAIERRRRDEEAERGRRDLAEAQRIAHLGSWVVDLASGAVTWSDEVHRIFGVAPGAFAGTQEQFLALVHPEDRDAMRGELARAVGTGAPYRLEYRIARPDGEVRTVLERAEVERDADGVIRRLIGTVLDITRRRLAEDALRAQTDRIATLAAERRRLIAASLAAEERTRQRIADLLHDGALQDLLAARQDLTQCIANLDDPPLLVIRADQGVAESIAGVRSAVGQLHPLTLTNGGLRTALEVVGRAVAERAGFRLRTLIGTDIGGEQNHLLLTLGREFLVNVEKHAAAREVTLRVDRLGDAVRLEVEDDGAGFTPGGDRDAFRVGHIGLASARERVEDLEGTLTVWSAAGTGTRIVAVVPSSPEPGSAGA